ncbi:MAG: hypothetical protein WD972_03250 [Candidatus Andersenbacteria bacterium]
MKFAVVEYSSKTGTVWRHTEERPNYLADPQREIDPTSFGCYVSAIKGEHVPLTGLILGPVAAVPPITQFGRRLYRKLTGRWPLYSLDYLSRFEVLLFVHQISDAPEVVQALKRIRALYPSIIVLGVPTQPWGILQSHFDEDPAARQHLVDFMDNCHLFLTIVEETHAWYQKLTKTKVMYVPQPYPVEYASHHFQPREKKLKKILVAGVTQRDTITKGQLVARQLQQAFPDYTIVVPKVADLDYDATALVGSQYEVLPFEEWQQHLKTLSTVMLVINTDYTFTRGRIQVDCAAVGTPSLGSNSDAQRDLWPELAAGPQDSIETLVSLATRVLRDPTYYAAQVKHARDKLPAYNYPTSATRLASLVEVVKNS